MKETGGEKPSLQNNDKKYQALFLTEDSSENDFAQRMAEVASKEALLKEWFDGSFHQQDEETHEEVQHLLRSEVKSLCVLYTCPTFSKH